MMKNVLAAVLAAREGVSLAKDRTEINFLAPIANVYNVF